MCSEVTLELASSGTQVQPKIVFDPDYLLDSLCVSYDYDSFKQVYAMLSIFTLSLYISKIHSLEVTFESYFLFFYAFIDCF